MSARLKRGTAAALKLYAEATVQGVAIGIAACITIGVPTYLTCAGVEYLWDAHKLRKAAVLRRSADEARLLYDFARIKRNRWTPMEASHALKWDQAEAYRNYQWYAARDSTFARELRDSNEQIDTRE